MTHSNDEQQRRLLDAHHRRLHLLEMRAAQQGILVDPGVLIEIDELKAKIHQIEQSSVGKTPTNVAPTNTQSASHSPKPQAASSTTQSNSSRRTQITIGAILIGVVLALIIGANGFPLRNAESVIVPATATSEATNKPATVIQEPTNNTALEPTTAADFVATPPISTSVPIPSTLAQQTTGPSTSMPSDHIIAPGSSKAGSLTEGQTLSFAFIGHANTPLLFTIEVEKNITYRVKITDNQDFELAEKGPYTYYTSPAQIPFTPQTDGEYLVQLVGTNNFGSYNLKLDYIAEPPEERNVTTPLDLGGSAKGNIAVAAIDQYSFFGTTNTPVLLTIEVEGNLSYNIVITNAKNEKLVQKGPYTYYTSPAQIPFTPQTDGEYLVQLIGTNNFGSYNLKLGYIAGPPEGRNVTTPLNIGGSAKGNIAVAAIDQYSFFGTTNTPVLLTIEVEGNLSYNVVITNAKNEKLVQKGPYTYYTSPAQIPFTPQTDGEYLVQLIGTNNFGSYNLALRTP